MFITPRAKFLLISNALSIAIRQKKSSRINLVTFAFNDVKNSRYSSSVQLPTASYIFCVTDIVNRNRDCACRKQAMGLTPMREKRVMFSKPMANHTEFLSPSFPLSIDVKFVS